MFCLYFCASKNLKAINFLHFRLDKISSKKQTMYTAAKNTGYILECLWLVCTGLEKCVLLLLATARSSALKMASLLA